MKDGVEEIYEGDSVIVTVPLSILKSGAITFSPELPESKQNAISKLGAGVVDKVIFLFPYHFWDITSDWLNLISDVPGEFP